MNCVSSWVALSPRIATLINLRCEKSFFKFFFSCKKSIVRSKTFEMASLRRFSTIPVCLTKDRPKVLAVIPEDANVDDFNKFKRAFGSQEGDRKYREEFDFNDDGVINTLDLSIFRSQASGTIKYTISCRNGAQQ